MWHFVNHIQYVQISFRKVRALTLESLARIWFYKSPLQHEVIVKNLFRNKANVKKILEETI